MLIVIGAVLVVSVYFSGVPSPTKDAAPISVSQPDQETDAPFSCTDAQKPSADFSAADIPAGWKLYVNEEIGFRFAYPADIRIESQTGTTNFSADGSCVYAGGVRLIADRWEAGLNATRGDYATGREGFNGTREVSFDTKKGTTGSILVDPVCGAEGDPAWGPDCGHWVTFEENGINFLFSSSPKEYVQSDFDAMPDFAAVLSTIETLPL